MEGAIAIAPAPISSSFSPETQAFTVERYADPGPKRSRFSFAKIADVLELPDLIELQKASLPLVHHRRY